MNKIKQFFLDAKMMVKIVKDFTLGFYYLKNAGKHITIYGSARYKEDHPYYQLAKRIGSMVAHEGYCVMTGGGPGIMEAAAGGAKLAGGRTFGCNILLPHEQKPNPYLDYIATFNYFFARKLMLNQHAKAFIIMPGGFGTIDEFMEIITLMQTGKIPRRPIILVTKDYWQDFFNFMQTKMIQEKTINQTDLDLILFTDSLDEIRKAVQQISH